MHLPTKPSDPYPPPQCAPTLYMVAEADEFLAAATETDYYEGGWAVRRGNWWSGSLPYLGEQLWTPSQYIYNRRRVRSKINNEMLAVTVPVARELVSYSATQVVGEGPNLYVENPEHQHMLDEMVYETELVATLLHAAEWASAYGGAYLRVFPGEPYPIMSVVRPDLAVPEWHNGRLYEVTFETKLPPPEMDSTHYRKDNVLWWRLLERHYINDMGMAEIEYALYASGSRDTIGKMRPLTDHPATAMLAQVTDSNGMVGRQPTDLDHITVHYIPNIRSRFTSTYLEEGRSDLDSCVDILRVIDLVASSVAEEIQVGKPKIVVPEQFITTADGRKMFQEGNNVYEGLMADPGLMSEANLIKQIEFKFEHMARIGYADYFRRLAVVSAGWSPQDFGYDMQGYAESGTALRERKIKSLSTQSRKRRQFIPPMERAIQDMLHFMGIDTRVKGEFPAAVATPTDLERAEILERYARSGVLSRYEMIRYLRPDWSEEQINEELDRDPAGYGAPQEQDLKEGPADNQSTTQEEASQPEKNEGRM